MHCLTTLTSAAALAGSAFAFTEHTVAQDVLADSTAAVSVNAVCTQIAHSVSSASEVFWPGTDEYARDIGHWAASSTTTSACSVEPGTAEDVGQILQILGVTRTPFAVKGGGHTTNPGFSSTPGVQIAMYRFSDVVYNAKAQTVDVGAGLIWDQVYEKLAPFGVNVVGGRVSGVGVAGFSLGGGYSWLTNQYGLTLDNIIGYELVLPDGEITSVTEASQPDLFFSLKGGYNNFGIVTKFVMKTYAQGQVWGGIAVVNGSYLDAVSTATARFSNEVKDPKAAVLPTYNFAYGAPSVSILMFYDGPTPPAGIFDDFLATPALMSNVSSRSFLSLVQASPSGTTAGTRGVFNSVSLVDISPALLEAVVNESLHWGPSLSSQSAVFVSYAVEPFLSSLLTHGSVSTAAYPSSRDRGLMPLNIYIAWTSPSADDVMRAAAHQSAQRLVAVADAEGQNVADAPLYGNYAMAGTSLKQIFGVSATRMRATKARVDPFNVMELAGGWKL